MVKLFGVKVIFNDILLIINMGEIVGFFGWNGIGKFILFKIIFGVL